LADPTRRAMIHRLAQREHTVGELCEPFAMSLAGGSKHIKVLEGAGLLERRVAGRTHYCKLRASHLADVHRWLAHFERYWNTQLDALEALLHAQDEATAKRTRPTPKHTKARR